LNHSGARGLPVREARALPDQDFGFTPVEAGFDERWLWEVEPLVSNPTIKGLVGHVAEVTADLRLRHKPVDTSILVNINRRCWSS